MPSAAGQQWRLGEAGLLEQRGRSRQSSGGGRTVSSCGMSSGWTERRRKDSCVQYGKADCAWCWWDRAHREEATAERIAERNLDLVLRKRERMG